MLDEPRVRSVTVSRNDNTGTELTKSTHGLRPFIEVCFCRVAKPVAAHDHAASEQDALARKVHNYLVRCLRWARIVDALGVAEAVGRATQPTEQTSPNLTASNPRDRV